MKALISWALLLLTVSEAMTETFDCFHDNCIRGVQYCMVDVERCGYCSHIEKQCGTADIPRDCDGYCARIEMEKIARSLNTTLKEKHDLSEEVFQLRIQIQVLKDNGSRETGPLKTNLKQINISLNRCSAEKANLLEHVNTSRMELGACQSSKERWFISNIVLGCIIAVITIAIIYLLLLRPKKDYDHHRNEEEDMNGNGYEDDQLIEEHDDPDKMSKGNVLGDSGVSLEDMSEGGSRSHNAEEESLGFVVDSYVDVGQEGEKQSPEVVRVLIGPNNIAPSSPSGPTETLYT